MVTRTASYDHRLCTGELALFKSVFDWPSTQTNRRDIVVRIRPGMIGTALDDDVAAFDCLTSSRIKSDLPKHDA